MDKEKLVEDGHNHQTNIMTCFKPKEVCLGEKDLQGMAAIRYTADP
jgi:hypothetical protein